MSESVGPSTPMAAALEHAWAVIRAPALRRTGRGVVLALGVGRCPPWPAAVVPFRRDSLIREWL